MPKTARSTFQAPDKAGKVGRFSIVRRLPCLLPLYRARNTCVKA